MSRVLTAVLLCGLSLALVREGEACSRAACDGAHFLPRGPVPSTLMALRWRPSEDQSARAPWIADDIVLEGSDGRSIAVEVTSVAGEYTLTLQDRLRTNTEYSVRAPELCRLGSGNGVVATRFETTSAHGLPEDLGRLEFESGRLRQLVLRNNGASCTESVDVVASRVTVTLTPEAELWRNALEWETLVDGEPWQPHPGLPHVLPFGQSWRGAEHDEIFVLCGDSKDFAGTRRLSEGSHTVVMQARLPGVDRVWSTTPVDIDLYCDQQAAEGDAGADRDAGPDSDAHGGGLQLDEQGCACRESSALGTHLLLFGMLAFGLSRKQRRR